MVSHQDFSPWLSNESYPWKYRLSHQNDLIPRKNLGFLFLFSCSNGHFWSKNSSWFTCFDLFFQICVKFLIWCDFWVKWIIIVLCIFLCFVSEIKVLSRYGARCCLLIKYSPRHVNGTSNQHVRTWSLSSYFKINILSAYHVSIPSFWLAGTE